MCHFKIKFMNVFNFIDRNVDRLDGCVYTVPNAHNGIINAIDTVGSVENHGASEIVTGGQDGVVKVWDPRCKEAVVQIEPTTNVSEDNFYFDANKNNLTLVIEQTFQCDN